MKKIEVEVPEGKKVAWVNGVLTLVDNKPANVMERIKTFEDACNELGEDHPFVITYHAFEHDVRAYVGMEYLKDVIAYVKLRIITAALNEDEDDNNEYRWIPWFKRTNNGGVACEDAGGASSDSSTDVGSRLALKSRELAKYAGKQFCDIWKDYIL